MDHTFYQCPTCGHLETEEAYEGFAPDALCPSKACHETVMVQYQRRTMRIAGGSNGDSE